MHMTEVHAFARKLYEAHGPRAVAEAAQKASTLEAAGKVDEARDWRRIEAAIREMKGPRET